MKILDASHPFFRPLWRRLVIVGVSLGWSAFEYANGETVWALFFAGIGLYCAWVLLAAYQPGNGEQDADG
jgi:hypothetical protein